MRYVFSIVIIAFLSSGAVAQNTGEAAQDPPPVLEPLAADGLDLNDFLWVSRPVVVFADAAADPRFIRQMSLLAEFPGELLERDVVVITDTDPAAKSEIREKLRPRGFMLALIGKDGTVLLRKPLPWSVRELTHSIDKLPDRQQEERDRRQSAQ